MTLITGIVGIVLLGVFLGILVWWIKALPLTVIIVAVVLLMVYDFAHTVRHGENGGGP